MQIWSSNLKSYIQKFEMKLIQYPSCRTDFSNPNFPNSLIRYPAKLLHFRNWEDFGQQQRKSILFETIKDKFNVKNEVNEKYNLSLCVCEITKQISIIIHQNHSFHHMLIGTLTQS